MFPYHRLRVWSKAHAIAVEVLRCKELDRDPSARVLAAQLRRATLSVAANIAEGAGSTSHALFARFLGIALASAHEAESHLLVGRDAGLLSEELYRRLGPETEEVKRMLTSLLSRVRTDPRARARIR